MSFKGDYDTASFESQSRAIRISDASRCEERRGKSSSICFTSVRFPSRFCISAEFPCN